MQTLSTDTCPTCKTPRFSDKINYYDGELRLFQSAAKAQCPRCSFVLRCVVWASANDILELSDVQKIRVWAGGSLSVYLRRRYVMLEVFTLEKPAPRLTPLRLDRCRALLPGSTGSDKTLSTIAGWMRECSTAHRECRASQGGSTPPFTPKRLLEIEPDKIYLRENAAPASYACLSHCWGPVGGITKLTLSNYDAYITRQEPIPEDALTATFRDAVSMCRRLGITHCWIDSLCIIQDSHPDWLDQAARMADVYAHASVTLAATTSPGSSDGFLRTTAHRYLGEAAFPEFPGVYIREEPPRWPTHWGTLDDSPHWPLLQRGWTYQEMRLSQRTLHFCAQEVVWECRTARRSESAVSDEVFGARGYANTRYEAVPYGVLAKGQPGKLWWRTVQDYSRRKLTFTSDKLPALAALAEGMSAERGGDRYLAGLWESSLLLDLVWMVWPAPKMATSGRMRDVWPTWSWVSIYGQVIWPSSLDRALRNVVVERVEYEAVGSPFMGQFEGGRVTLKAPLLQGTGLVREYIAIHRTGREDDGGNDLRPWEGTRREIMIYDVKEDSADWEAVVTAGDVFIAVLCCDTLNESCYGLLVSPAEDEQEGGYVRIGNVQIKHRDSRDNDPRKWSGDAGSEDERDYAREEALAKDLFGVLEDLPTTAFTLV